MTDFKDFRGGNSKCNLIGTAADRHHSSIGRRLNNISVDRYHTADKHRNNILADRHRMVDRHRNSIPSHMVVEEEAITR